MIQHLGRIRLFGGKKRKENMHATGCVVCADFSLREREPVLTDGFCRKSKRKILSPTEGQIFDCNLYGSSLMNNSK